MSNFQNIGRTIIQPPPQQQEAKRSITKGLFGVDPNQLQRKQQLKKLYQQQLKKQIQDQKKRKQQKKIKQRQQDQKLQRKIKQSLNQQADKNSNINPNKNRGINVTVNENKNPNTLSNSRFRRNQQSDPDLFSFKGNANQLSSYQTYQRQSYNQLSNNNNNNNEHRLQQNYLNTNIYSYQQQKLLMEENQNKLRRFKQSLDQKLQEVYKHIQSGKNTLGSNNSVIQQMKRRLKSNTYMVQDYNNQIQKSGIKQFQQQFSQFYKIPKKTLDRSLSSNSRLKNLDFDSESRFKSSFKSYGNSYNDLLSSNIKQKSNTDRLQSTNYQNKTNSNKKWGNQKNKNYLGNRQSLDFQVDRMLSKIDNILENNNKTGQNY